MNHMNTTVLSGIPVADLSTFIRRTVIDKNNLQIAVSLMVFREIRFPLDRVNDDEVVALHAYAECKKIVFLNKDTYFYRIRKIYFMRQSLPVFYMIFHKAVSSHLSIDKFDIYFKQNKE